MRKSTISWGGLFFVLIICVLVYVFLPESEVQEPVINCDLSCNLECPDGVEEFSVVDGACACECVDLVCIGKCTSYCADQNLTMNTATQTEEGCNCQCNPDWEKWCDDKCTGECSDKYYLGYILEDMRCGCNCSPLLTVESCSNTCNATCFDKRMEMKNYSISNNVCQCECGA